MYCCISGCTNTSRMSKMKSNGVKFYYFPKNSTHMPWLCEKRQKWLNAVKKHTKRQNDFLPSKNTTICSDHFIGNKKTENPLDPSYIPTIFPGAKKKSKKLVNLEILGNRQQIQLAECEEKDTVKNSLELSTEDTNTTSEDPPNQQCNWEPLYQCRFCAEFLKDCVNLTEKDRPYLTANKTALTLNDLSIELDFNNASPKTVCKVCDEKLQEMYVFVKQVKEAQESPMSVRDDMKKEIETVTVKIKQKSPTPDNEVNDIESKDRIVDSITVTDTGFVKSVSKRKRKLVEAPKTKKKLKAVKNVDSVNSELIKIIKTEKNYERDDGHSIKVEKIHSDTEIDTRLIDFEHPTSSSVIKKSDYGILS